MFDIYVRAEDRSGGEAMPAQSFPALPAPGSRISWRDNLRVATDEPVTWTRRELVPGSVRWVATLTVDVEKSAPARGKQKN